MGRRGSNLSIYLMQPSSLPFPSLPFSSCLLGAFDAQVVRHVLARHDPLRCAESSNREGDDKRQAHAVRFRGNELLGLVQVAVGGVQVRDGTPTTKTTLPYCTAVCQTSPFLPCILNCS